MADLPTFSQDNGPNLVNFRVRGRGSEIARDKVKRQAMKSPCNYSALQLFEFLPFPAHMVVSCLKPSDALRSEMGEKLEE